MKFRVLAILAGVLLAGSLSAQTLTDVINEFNTGVEKLNNQEYEVSLEHFNQVLAMAGTVGDEANDMKLQAEKQIPAAYYRQATTFMKRKQYDNAIPYLEKTVETASLYNNNEEFSNKAANYLPQLYVREGNREWKNKSYDAAIACFDKSLALNENLYQAHQGKGMVYLDQDETDMMLESFAKAKEGALSKNDTKTIESIHSKINKYYKKIIDDEYVMVDPEEKDYTFVLEVCEKALEANDKNAYAYLRLAEIKNTTNEFDAALEFGKKGICVVKDPVILSGLYFQVGLAHQNSSDYDSACEAYKQVVEEPFLTKAEKKIEFVGCN